MREFAIRPSDIFEIISRHKKYILKAFVGTFVFIMLAFLVVPRTYQTETIVHIGVNYFQNPLIGDLISQTHDPGELRSEREKIIKSSLGIEFANKVGDKFSLFKSKPKDPARAVEVDLFLKTLDISPVTSTQFRIKFKARKAEVADGLIHGAIDSIREYMYVNRVQMLQELLSVLHNEITTTADENAVGAGAPPVLGARSEAAKAHVTAQIEMLEKRLSDLQRTYNEQHPSVQGLKTEISELRTAQRGGFTPGLTRRRIFRGGGASSLGTMTIKDDLSKQKHLVNISLEMEKKDPSMSAYLSLVKEPMYPKKPIFPKLRMFLLFALIAGVMVATLTVAVLEFWQRTELAPKELAKKLNLELLGTLKLE